jgi:hypothetical protein
LCAFEPSHCGPAVAEAATDIHEVLCQLDRLSGDFKHIKHNYDALGRLGGTDSHGFTVDCGTDGSVWGPTFTYDQFGNISKSGSNGTTSSRVSSINLELQDEVQLE